MNRKMALLWSLSLLLGFSGAWADEHDSDNEAETTIRLMGAHDGELPDQVTRDINLPALPEDTEAVEAAADGLQTADDNIARREDGLATAEDALEDAQSIAEDALENIENRGRSEDFVPEDIPDTPEVPQPPTG